MDIKKVLSAIKLAAAKSPQVIVKDETRDIVDCIRKIKKYEDISWTEEELKILKTIYPAQGAKACLVALADKKYYRTIAAITCCAKLLGLKSGAISYWTEEETTLLTETYPKYGGTCTKFFPNRKPETVLKRASDLGLQAPKTDWTETEDQIILKYYPSEGASCIKRLPNRSRRAVLCRAYTLGVSCKTNRPTSKKIRCTDTGFIGTCKEVSEQYRIATANLLAVASGRRKSAGGHHFEYVEE